MSNGEDRRVQRVEQITVAVVALAAANAEASQ